MNDSDLRNLFAHERRSDADRAPQFQHVLTRARASAPASRSWLLRPLLALAVVLIAVLTVTMWPQPTPKPSLAQSLPVLLPKQTQPTSSLFASLGNPTPSDFLLPRLSNFKVL